MRAEFLGAAGPTDLMRCVCGARAYLSRRHWARRGFTVCDECKAVIRYGSLEVVEAHDSEDFFTMVISQEEEREALTADVERELRRFVRAYEQQPEWLWSPATQRFVQTVRPKLELLGGPIGPMDAGAEYGAAPEAAYAGDEDGEPSEEAYDEEPDAA
jgi:hypothetical protein